MNRLRSLLWLVALVALASPSLGARISPVQAATEQGTAHAAMAGCDEHKLPPDDCPSKDTAKHLAGDCCPPMGGAIALLPAAVPSVPGALPETCHSPVSNDLTGLAPAQDPPPPRV